MVTRRFKIIFFVVAGLAFGSGAWADNLHWIDGDAQSGYALYRSGQPTHREFRELCAMGIQEIMVLSGNASEAEYLWAEECPGLKVIYNEAQSPLIPLTKSFLEDFDAWISAARTEGKKIAFRCNCGCHRTGRLAAYYQMKYQDLSPEAALEIMNRLGDYMWAFPRLKYQVHALHDYIEGRSCSTYRIDCVRKK